MKLSGENVTIFDASNMLLQQQFKELKFLCSKLILCFLVAEKYNEIINEESLS